MPPLSSGNDTIIERVTNRIVASGEKQSGKWLTSDRILYRLDCRQRGDVLTSLTEWTMDVLVSLTVGWEHIEKGHEEDNLS